MTLPANGWTKWLLALFAAMLIGLGGWGGKTLVTTGARVTRVETQHEDWQTRLGRIEDKLDRLIERSRSR